jgi:hypothetical protein
MSNFAALSQMANQAASAASTAATISEAVSPKGAPTPPPEQKKVEVSEADKKKAILSKYCNIINEKRGNIQEIVVENLKNYFNNIQNFKTKEGEGELNDDVLKKIIVDRILNELNTKLFTDYFAIHSLVRNMLEHEDLTIILNNAISNKYNNLNDTHFINPLNDAAEIYEYLKTELNKYSLEKQQLNGGQQPNEEQKGGDTEEETNQKIEEILAQIKYTDNSNVVNDSILYIIKKILQKVIDSDQMKRIIFDALKPKIQQSINTLLHPDVFNSVDLKKNILSAVLKDQQSNSVATIIHGGIQSYLSGCVNNNIKPTGDGLRKHLLEKFTIENLDINKEFADKSNVVGGGRIGNKRTRRNRRKSHPKRKRVIRKTYRRK